MTTTQSVLIAPSILSGDFGQLASDAQRVEQGGGDWLHCDVMDGCFVPNLTFGPDTVAALRRATRLPLDVHLMMERPDQYIEAFARAGATWLNMQIESMGNKKPGTEGRAVFEPNNPGVIADTLRAIAKSGCRPGLTLNPLTPAAAIHPYLELADLILVMTVWPGFGGQKFMTELLPKIREIRALVKRSGRDIHIEVDGGIDTETARQCVEAGANVLVAGTAVFRHKTLDLAGAVASLRHATDDQRGYKSE